MSAVSGTPTNPTDTSAPLHLAPRPAPPVRPLTAVRTFAWPTDGEADAPIEFALGAYGDGLPRGAA